MWNTVVPGAEVVSGGFLPPEVRACGPMCWRPTSAALRRPVGTAETCWASMSTADTRGSTDWDEHTHLHLFHLLLARLGHAPAHCYHMGRWIREGPCGEFPALWVKAAPRLWV